ncbi:AbiV family abortive infection protein [Brucella anthropi]|uniref:AbiV family abortive infection protein n=1 Tax=Brucella anthropi TaxID=529 RepID=UPI000288FFB6|nr:AbiV family abortive infection protein [Brucella anthropi]
MSSTLTQYKGPLTPAQATEGIALARANAARLIADAELLTKNGRHASASALAILAIEELGKVQAIKIIMLQSGAAELKEAWREYRNHRAKNVQWILPKLAGKGARTLAHVRAAADSAGEHTAMLDSVKQLSFYTDCYGEAGRWSEPSDAVDPKFAVSILATARMLNRQKVTTERELELWATIVGPHYDKPTMIDALLEFQKQVFLEGLSPTSAEEMEAFVTGRPVGARD